MVIGVVTLIWVLSVLKVVFILLTLVFPSCFSLQCSCKVVVYSDDVILGRHMDFIGCCCFHVVLSQSWYEIVVCCCRETSSSVGDWMVVLCSGVTLLLTYLVCCLIVLVCCDDIDFFCPYLLGVFCDYLVFCQ